MKGSMKGFWDKLLCIGWGFKIIYEYLYIYWAHPFYVCLAMIV